MKFKKKGGTRMNFRSHIPKPQLPRKLLLLAISLFTALPILFTTPLTTYADDFSADDVNAVVAAYNGTSDSNRGGNSAIVNGVSYTRTGYLCYLLTKDGSTVGLPAYAFVSPGYNGIAGSKWVCTSRRGQSVSGWYAPAPWNVTPWAEGGSPSNEPKIKDWALQMAPTGKPMAAQFVKDIWGLQAEKNFESDEYILVIETIMNFQYSVAGGSGGGGTVVIDRELLKRKAKAQASLIANHERLRGQEREDFIERVAPNLAAAALVKILADGAQGGGGRTFTSDPLIGTVPNLIQYKNGSKVFDSYTNKVAPHAEKIRVSEAGFTAYPSSGPNQLTDSEVQSYGVAMLIIHCKNDAIHSYWEPNGSPGNPEPRLPGKTGTCNIVKGYYKENLTTGAKESLGVYSELDVTSNIIVSSEPDFELIEYLCL